MIAGPIPTRRGRSISKPGQASIALCLLLAGGFDALGQDSVGKGGWVQLFNGKDLDGWTPKIKGYDPGDNHADTFRVQDGLLKVSYDRYPRFDGKFGHLFYKHKFSRY